MGIFDAFVRMQEMQRQPMSAMTPVNPLAPPVQQRPSFMQRLNSAFMPDPKSGQVSLFESPFLQMGLSLMGNARGSNWSGVAEDLRSINDRRTQQQLLQRAMRREDVDDRRVGTEFKQGQQDRAQSRAAFEAEIARLQTGNPEAASQLRALGPQGYQDFARLQQDDRQFQQSLALQRSEMEQRERLARLEASSSGLGRPLTPTFRATVRGQFATAQQLRQTYNDFVNMVRNADERTLLGLGPQGAALQAQQRLLAIQAKSPAALDLGALVGADFAILDDIIGNPDNWRRLVQNGGRDGVVARLEPFGAFMNSSEARLRNTYSDFSEQFPDLYAPSALPGADMGGGQTHLELRSPGLPSRGVYPESAIRRLLADPSGDAIREFDEMAGESGAAERLLRQRGVRSVSNYGGGNGNYWTGADRP